MYGVLWSVGMFSWFVSNGKLSQAIAFPISTRVRMHARRERSTTQLPGIVASVWGVFYFKEVTGARNLVTMVVAVVVAVAGVTCVGLADVV